MAEPPDLDLVAAALRADGADTAMFVEALAGKLEEALPQQVSVERKGGLFGGRKRVRRIVVDLEGHLYELDVDGAAPVGRRRNVVRGVALKTEQLGVDAWIAAISAELVELAGRSERDRVALERLLTG
jgi:hypothetical protein